MKLIKLLVGAILTVTTVQLNAQILGNDPEIKIEGLQPESAWQFLSRSTNPL